MAIAQECGEQYWIGPDGNTPQGTNYTAICLPITKTIQVRRTRHAGHCWRSKDELISDVLLWTPKYGQAKTGRPARTYIQQLCEDTGCNPEDLPKVMNEREKWLERVWDIHDSGRTWWWWYRQCLTCPKNIWKIKTQNNSKKVIRLRLINIYF